MKKSINKFIIETTFKKLNKDIKTIKGGHSGKGRTPGIKKVHEELPFGYWPHLF